MVGLDPEVTAEPDIAYVVGVQRGAQGGVVVVDVDARQPDDLLRLVLKRLLVLRGTGRVDQVAALVGGRLLTDRPRLGQRDDRVERVLLRRAQLTRGTRQQHRHQHQHRQRDHGGTGDGRIHPTT
ncbi:MAG TPA: hypothetical protein VGL06_29355 [Pseudonocardiaceae bacterium]